MKKEFNIDINDCYLLQYYFLLSIFLLQWNEGTGAGSSDEEDVVGDVADVTIAGECGGLGLAGRG